MKQFESKLTFHFFSMIMRKKSINQFLQIITAFLLVVHSTKSQILVDPNYMASMSKYGYNLIFQDEFNGNSLDLQKWDISTCLPADDVPCFTYLYDFMLSQVSVSEGNCILKTEKATAQNSNCMPFNQDCEDGDRGISGEIKNFQWRDYGTTPPDFPNVFFNNYEFPVGSYVEIRAKTTDANCNAGSSFWLYGGEQEIDIFETSGDEDDFTSGYWSGRNIKGQYYGPYERYRSGWNKFWGGDGKHPKIVSCGFSMREKIAVEELKLVWDESSGEWLEQTVTST